MPFPKTHRFRGTLYRLYWRKPPLTHKERKDQRKLKTKIGKIMGKIYPEETGIKPSIYIDPTYPPMEVFDTVLHEGMHAAFPDLDEIAIEDGTDCIWSLLKRMGFQVSFKK